MIHFRAYKHSNPGFHSHIREVRKKNKEKFEKASSIAAYPGDWIVGEVSLKAAKSLCERAIRLIELGRDAYYTWPHSLNSGYLGHISVWIDVLAYLNSEDRYRKTFGRFGGINNPFVTGDATLV